MIAPLDKVLAFSPAGVVAPASRLERSNNAKYKTALEIAQYCNQHDIPYVMPTLNIERVLPTQLLQELFERNFGIRPLSSTTLQHEGASTVIALESMNVNNPTSLHGQVMSTISEHVGAGLWPGIQSIYIQADANPEFRRAFTQTLDQPLKTLLEDQGVPVVLSSVGWNDLNLGFDHKPGDQFDHFWRVPAFVVSSAGNEGLKGEHGTMDAPLQKHMASSHAPPLAVSVGAAEKGEGGFYIPGYSAANSPTFLAPVAQKAKIKWKPESDPEDIIGTSAAGPYAGGVLASLNKRYGSYLTREQILFAVLATCDKTIVVKPFAKQTPYEYSIFYLPNAAGLTYNSGPGGFGLINAHRADHILAHMVAMTQQNPELVTVPTEHRVELKIKNAPSFVAKDGNYYYDIELPEGYALKTTIEAEFTNKRGKDVRHGQITLTSPSGTKFPMVTSRSQTHGIFNGLSTSHAWAGEQMGGRWRVCSSEPISRLRLSAYHFLEGDIVRQLDNDKLNEWHVTPAPDLSYAIPLTELKSDLRAFHVVKVRPRVQLAGPTLPDFVPSEQQPVLAQARL